MRIVAEAVKAMSQEEILSFEKSGEITIANHCLKLSDIKVLCYICLFFTLGRFFKVQNVNKREKKKYMDIFKMEFWSCRSFVSLNSLMG